MVRGHPLRTYAAGGEMGSTKKMSTAARRGEGKPRLICMYAHYLFS